VVGSPGLDPDPVPFTGRAPLRTGRDRDSRIAIEKPFLDAFAFATPLGLAWRTLASHGGAPYRGPDDCSAAQLKRAMTTAECEDVGVRMLADRYELKRKAMGVLGFVLTCVLFFVVIPLVLYVFGFNVYGGPSCEAYASGPMPGVDGDCLQWSDD
jgi:hypothetical protein